MDFLSRNGVRFLAPPESSSRTTQRVAAAAADALDAVLGDRFSVQRAELWAVLRRAEALPNKAPTLFVYSADDALAPLEVIETLAAALRDTGRPVTMQRWEHSGACGCARGAQTALLLQKTTRTDAIRRACAEHVGHLRRHPMQYVSALSSWLDAARRVWVERAAQLGCDRVASRL